MPSGIKAPGGVVIRTDTEGSGVQLVAGGLRNPYDLAFNRDGELFIHDADMESDEGTSWYRPTRLCHVVPGGEYGWRSGWSKWPEYYLDSLPAVVETGRGSPAGIVAYNHFMFPVRYHGCAVHRRLVAGQNPGDQAQAQRRELTRRRAKPSSKAIRSTSPISKSAPTAGSISAPAAAAPAAAFIASRGRARFPRT